MLTYKIFLNTDMTIKDVISSGNLVQYSWNNISVNVYIPKAIYETSPSISNTVSMTFTQTKENGDTVITNNARLYEFSYVKDNVMVGNIEYVLLTRQMPQQMTLYFGNTQMFQINHLVISDNEIISFAASPFQRYEVFQASNTQETHDEPSTVDELQADINNLKRRTDQLEAYKQDKANADINVRTVSAVSDNPNYFTSNVTVGLNVLSTRTDTVEIDNKKNKEDIAEIKATMTSQFTPLGKLEGNTAEPTLAQINAWLSTQGITQPELGNLITYVGHVTGAVDTNYNCLYTKNGWIWYETTSLETASNTEMGIVKGNGNNSNANEVVDIQNGQIQGIKVKDMNGTQRYLKGYINDLEDNQAKILDGTTTVPKATNSQNDGLGNNIQATYQTKTIGASKQYVKDYALAKLFNDMNYINYTTDVIEPTYVGGTKEVAVSNIGDTRLFSAIYHNETYEYSLSQGNVFTIKLPVMVDSQKTLKFKAIIKLDNGIDTPYIIGTSESSNINFLANQIQYVNIQGTFTSLVKPVKITPDSHLIVELYVFNDIQSTFNLSIYNTLSQPSTFTLTIPYQTIQIIQGGAIGQQYLHNVCNYNATATSSLGVGYVFDIDSELVNNTEHKFIARVTDISQHMDYTYIRVASGGVEIPVIATFEEGEEQQPYYEPWHRKFLYVIDDNTAVIMFSAFYTNGQFIIVEPNDVDYAKEIVFENIVDGTTPVGKARADQLGNVIDTTYATKVELSSVNTKSLYHLGTFDTVVENADGTVTITRQTGYVDLGKLEWTKLTAYNYVYSTGDLSSYISKPVNDNTKGDIISNIYETIAVSPLNDTTLSKIAIDSHGAIFVNTGNANSPTGIAQYKLATSYQEKVIPNRPLNTLDQNGSQWVREEWEKGLNLCKDSGISITVNAGSEQWSNISNAKLKSYGLENGKTYTVCVFNVPSNLTAQLTPNYQTITSPYKFVMSNSIQLRVGNNTVATTTTFNLDLMIIEGVGITNYQPYNANKHITNDEANLLKDIKPNFYQIKKFTGTWGQWVNTKGNDNVNVLKALVSVDVSEDEYHYIDLIKTYDSVNESIMWVYMNSGSSSPFHDVLIDEQVIIYYVDLYEV